MFTIDFETYFAPDYSLKTMSPVEYVRDPRFKILGVGVKENDQPTQWWTDRFERLVPLLNGQQIIGHNLVFDGLILVERLGLPPVQNWADTLGMSKAVFPHADKHSLNHLCNMRDLRHQKMTGVLQSFSGIRNPSPEQLIVLGEYCKADVDATYELLRDIIGFMSHVPPAEWELLRLTTQMGVWGQLKMDVKLLEEALEDAQTERAEAIKSSGLPESILSSNAKFGKWMESVGIEIPIKISKTTCNETSALSKNDQEWIDLKMKYPEWTHVWNAREMVKSNLPITRARKFLNIAKTEKNTLPVPLQYYGAHTGRFSGRSYNLQNLPRGGKLRLSLIAPEGMSLIIGDLAQIEARVTAFLAGQEDMLQIFRDGGDLYKEFAAKFFGKPTMDVQKTERQFAKAMCLGLGFGMGPSRFQAEAKKGFLGTPPKNLSNIEAMDAVMKYRAINRNIAKLWGECTQLLVMMTHRDLLEAPADWKAGIKISYQAIILPNGMRMAYPGLIATDDGQWFFGTKRTIWAGSLCENIVQAFARIVMTNALLDASREGLNPVFTCHDEIVCLVPDDCGDASQQRLKELMTTTKPNYRDLPLDAEINISKRYDK